MLCGEIGNLSSGSRGSGERLFLRFSPERERTVRIRPILAIVGTSAFLASRAEADRRKTTLPGQQRPKMHPAYALSSALWEGYIG
jgi:hypothetical protein